MRPPFSFVDKAIDDLFVGDARGVVVILKPVRTFSDVVVERDCVWRCGDYFCCWVV